jgi:TonB family protein
MLRRYPTAFGAFAALLTVSWIPLHAADAPAATEEKLVADGPALLREWQPPLYPGALLKARQSGMVNVRVVVDANGKITAARALEDSDAPFVEAAIAAVNQWTFAPALENGQPVDSCVDTLVTFSPAVGQQKPTRNNLPPSDQQVVPASRVSPRAQFAPPGDYPAVLSERKFAGVLRFGCVVTTDGRVVQPRILAASHVDFVLPALEALQKWEFSPAMQGDLVVQQPVDGKMTFDALVGRIDEMLAANGITAPDGSAPTVTPEPLIVVDPVLPVDALLKGEGGSATVDFTVGETGSVKNIRVREATHPEFGDALAAALEAWAFARPVENNRTVEVELTRRVEFAAVPVDATSETEGDGLTRLVMALRAGGIGGARGLDGKLTPIYQVRPEYPRTLKEQGGPAGKAEIEFVIDREGRVRLPRIASATHPEFGWAAATAVSQWVFNPPRRAGEPVDIKVKIPMTFAALEN